MTFSAIEEDLPTTSTAWNESEEPIVEEPEDAGQLVLSDDLVNYLNRMKSERILPIGAQNKQIVLYNPGTSMLSRIVEISDALHDKEELLEEENSPTVESNSSSPIAGSPKTLDDEEQMDID